MSGAEIVATSPAILPPDSSYQRRPRAPWRKRGSDFERGFDRLTLFYDCFRAVDGERVLLVGPPLRNLKRLVERADFCADGGGVRLGCRIYSSGTVSVTELLNVPAAAKTIVFDVAGRQFSLEIQPNYADRLAGRRLLFTMNRDNAAEWLSGWAGYHRKFHGVDAIVLFDNGSTNLTTEEIGAALARSGAPEIFVVPWNHPYGPYDPKVLINPYWARFAQVGAMSVALRRFGMAAAGILNCDIDELVHTSHAPDIFAELDRTPQGLLVMRGNWVETAGSQGAFGDHRDFRYRLRDAKARHCAQKKWALDPRRPWVGDLNVHPYMHWIEGRPRGAKSTPPGVFYWHFKGINTNWKTARNVPGAEDAAALEPDAELAGVFENWR